MTTANRRHTPEPVQIRSGTVTRSNSRSTAPLVACGYALKFNTRTRISGFYEEIAPGAARDTIERGDDIVALFNHHEDLVLGRSSAGTLRLGEDNVGVWYEIDLPDTTTGRDVGELLRRGDIIGSSFAFRNVDDEWSETETGYPVRTLRSFDLVDVSPVTFPAYKTAEAGLGTALV